MSYPLTPVRAAIINKSTSASEDVEKGEPLCTVGGNADWCSHTVESSMKIPQKIKNGSAF